MFETLQSIAREFPAGLAALIFILGAIWGSFLNVCIHRIPAGRSIVFPGSTCACGQPIAWYHNLPILSWCVLRGKAICCSRPFSVRYPAIELLTALLFLCSWWIHGPVVAMIGMVFVSILICATFIDFDYMIIPDRFSIGGMILGVILSILFPVLHNIESIGSVASIRSGVCSAIGVLVGSGLVYWISVLGEIVFRKPAMGEGDVKFVGMIGAFCGWQGALFAIFGGALIGSVVLLPLLLLGRIFGWSRTVEYEEDSIKERVEIAFGSAVPFGPMLAGAGCLYFMGFSQYVDAYLADFAQFFMTK